MKDTNTLNVTQVKNDIFRVANGIKRISENIEYYGNQVKFLQSCVPIYQCIGLNLGLKCVRDWLQLSDWGTSIG